jgi:hypothetical protein
MTTTYFLDNGQNSGFNLFKEEDHVRNRMPVSLRGGGGELGN